MFNDILKIYQKNNKFLVLNPFVPTWIITNIRGILILQVYDATESFSSTVEEFCKYDKHTSKFAILHFLQQAQDINLFKIDTSIKTHKPYHLSGIYFNMTQQCNLHCIYCFAATRTEHGFAELTLEDYYRILNEAKQIYPTIDINFTGGEPLLSPKTLSVAKYAKSIGFTTRLLTNATLIDEGNVDQISECFDFFKISIDGSTKEKHEYYRGTNSYDKTMHAIELLKARHESVTVAMVVTRQNMNDVNEMNKKWGNMLTYQPLFPLGRAKDKRNDIALTGEEYYHTLCFNPNINPFENISNIINAHRNMKSIIKCSIGDGELSISSTGDVYPCQLLHHEQFLLGNIKNSSLNEIYNGDENKQYKFNTVDTIDKCKICDFKYLCGGACQARHFSETGSIHKTGDFCEYEKKGIIDGLIKNCEMIKFE